MKSYFASGGSEALEKGNKGVLPDHLIKKAADKRKEDQKKK